MTGRDLIIYILQNELLNEPVFKDGKFIGFITDSEAAIKMNVGKATIWAWYALGKIPGIILGNTIYIPADCEVIKSE